MSADLKKYIMPTMEAQIIELSDHRKFKTRLDKDKKKVCEIALRMLEPLDLPELATHFNPPYNRSLERKMKEFEEKQKLPPPSNDDGNDAA